MARAMVLLLRGSWSVLAASGLVLILTGWPLMSLAADQPERGDGKVDRATETRKAAELFQALQELSSAVEREQKQLAGKTPEEVLNDLGRPARSAAVPSLTSTEVDSIIDRSLASQKAPRSRLTGDEEFLRRLTLDLAGRLPTPTQHDSFLRDNDPAKRAKLIDQLLDDPAFGTNWGRYWRDVILYRATNPTIRRYGVDTLAEWLAEQFNANRPWDEIATELITATGSSAEDGRVIFHLAHADQARVSPVEVAGEVSRVFLGVQIACAQCHDHPTDPWTRKQFHEFAALFAGTFARPNSRPAGRDGFTIQNFPNSPRYTMPDLEDPEKSIGIAPAFFLASSERKPPANLTAQQRRAVAASFVTGQDNPWFARAFVNRVCYALLGQAFYTPVDDLGPAREPDQPELLEALASQFTASGYDIKWLYRTLLNTRAYQRASRDTTSEAGLASMASNVSSRLRADQIADALAQVLIPPALGFGADQKRPGMAGAGGGAGAGANAVRANQRLGFNFIFGVDPSTPNEEVLGTIPQSLAMMNSPGLNQAITARPGSTLGRLLRSHPQDSDAVRAIYQQVLSRNPSNREQDVALDYIQKVGARTEAFEDLFWSLLNTTEFISRK